MRKIAAIALLTLLPFPAFSAPLIYADSGAYPFLRTVAERAEKSAMQNIAVQNKGAAAALSALCAEKDAPPIAATARRMKKAELESCIKNNFSEIREIPFGFDAWVVTRAPRAQPLDLSAAEIWHALIKYLPDKNGKVSRNPYQNWNDIDKRLPGYRIEIMAPAMDSALYPSFAEAVMKRACRAYPEMAALEEKDMAAFDANCAPLRQDGNYIAAGDDWTLNLQRAAAKLQMIGIFHYKFMKDADGRVAINPVGGVMPLESDIQSGAYPLSRPLYIYVNEALLKNAPLAQNFIAALLDESALSEKGYLAGLGLVPPPPAARDSLRNAATFLDAAQLP